MARDAPHPDLSDSELRDVPHVPRTVVDASITTIHPQLRDLIVCPQVAGRVYHVKARGVVEVVLDGLGGAGEVGQARSGEERSKSAMARQVRTMVELQFTPNCLAASSTLLACGGQSGELYIKPLPPYPYHSAIVSTDSGWHINMTLPHSSINNSFLLLPPHTDDPLPTRPSTPTPFVRPRYPHASQSGTTGEGIATFPNTLPAGGSLGLGLTGAHAHAHDRHAASPQPPAGLSYEELRAWQTLRANAAAESGASSRRRSARLDGLWDQVVEQHRDREHDRLRDPRDPTHRSSASPAAGWPFRGVVAGIASSPAHSPYPSPAPTLYSYRPRAPPSASPSTASSLGSMTPATPDPSASRLDEPRLLISNNDMSVKVFAIRNGVSPGSSSSAGTLEELWRDDMRRERDWARWGDVPKAPPRHHKLAKVGSLKLTTAVNHSSVSPDGKTMVVVGDTTDVFLYDIIGGGRDFRRIGHYQGASDSGFSTAWSKDGRKFAVASQDGQCTVWDHRSSHPLAKMFTSPVQRRSSPSFSSDISALYNYWDAADEEGYNYYHGLASPTGTSTRVRRDPARVVKFSPEGSSRDLMVFTEENNNIHIVDARTFTTQLTLPVPKEATSQPVDPSAETRSSAGVSSIKGISGACFDPTGDFLYTGTDRTIVEYDLRTTRKRGSGWAGMA